MACYLRVFINKTFSRIILVNGAIVVAFWICSLLVTISLCNPASKAWDIQIQDSQCGQVLNYFYVAAVVNGITDLVLCVAPLPLVYQLKITTKEKVIVSVLFGLGFLSVAFLDIGLEPCAIRLQLTMSQCLRCSFHSTISSTRTIINRFQPYVSQKNKISIMWKRANDPLEAVTYSLEWAAIELGIGIFCQCVPSFRPLFGKFLSSVVASTHEPRTRTISGITPSARNRDRRISEVGD